MRFADASQAVPLSSPMGQWRSGLNGQSDKDAFDVLHATEERELRAALDDAFCGGPGDRPGTQCLPLLESIHSADSKRLILSSDCVDLYNITVQYAYFCTQTSIAECGIRDGGSDTQARLIRRLGRPCRMSHAWASTIELS